MRALWVLVAGLLLGACTLPSLSGVLLGGQSALERENEAARELGAAIDDYLALTAEQPSNPASADIERFVVEGERRTERLRAAYDEWSDSVDQLIAKDELPEGESVSDVRDWQQALGEWVTSMEQQQRVMKPCLEGGSINQSCVLEVYNRYGQEWLEMGNRVNRVRERISNERGRP